MNQTSTPDPSNESNVAGETPAADQGAKNLPKSTEQLPHEPGSEMKQPVDGYARPKWLLGGLIAAGAWFSVLALGVLIPSEDYRKELGWIPEKSERATEGENLLKGVKKLLDEQSPDDGAGLPGPITTQPTSTDLDTVKRRIASDDATGKKTPAELADVKCDNCRQSVIQSQTLCSHCKVAGRTFWNSLGPFVVASLSFVPLNICILTVLAAFVGGCSVNQGELAWLEKLVAQHDAAPTRPPEADRDQKRLNYLREHPGYSGLRGLVVFLVLVSGLLIAGNASFIFEGSQTDQLMQYFRLAGIFSFFGYLAGSDPTLFASMIEFGSARLRQPQPQPQPQPQVQPQPQPPAP